MGGAVVHEGKLPIWWDQGDCPVNVKALQVGTLVEIAVIKNDLGAKQQRAGVDGDIRGITAGKRWE